MAEAFDPNEDPGWPHGLSALAFMVPGSVQWRFRRGSSVDGLFMLRQVVVSFAASLLLFGVVIASIKLSAGSALPWLAALAMIALVVTAAERVVERPLDCSSAPALAANYRTRFFLRIAFAQSVAMFGFVFVFIGAPKWIYFAGTAFTLARFWTGIAPTRAALARDQETLTAQGCGLSLISALRSTPPSAIAGPTKPDS